MELWLYGRNITGRVVQQYVHPLTKVPLIVGEHNNLYDPENPSHIVYKSDEGTYDFVGEAFNEEEREYYNHLPRSDLSESLSIVKCKRVWETYRGFGRLLGSMGDIAGKKILLLGNGTSAKEFYFLRLGASCVYTDLSLDCVKHMRNVFGDSEFLSSGFDKIEFHAADACHLPFGDGSFDIVYGCAFVHHVQDLRGLFAEVVRCLKPDGVCRFFDHAYSPLWQMLKAGLLKPLQTYAHRKHGISPADLLATRRGGYKYEELKDIQRAFAFREMVYERVTFLQYLLERGTSKLGGRCLRRLRPLAKGLDSFLDRVSGLVRNHGITLVWGFDK